VNSSANEFVRFYGKIGLWKHGNLILTKLTILNVEHCEFHCVWTETVGVARWATQLHVAHRAEWIWKGRVTIIAAVTPALDRHSSIFSTLGGRLMHKNTHRPDSEEVGQWAIRQQGHEEEIRQECGRAISQLFAVAAESPPILPATCERQLAAIAELTAVARTHVYRSSWGERELEYVPEPEANTRIAKGLAALARGIAALNRR